MSTKNQCLNFVCRYQRKRETKICGSWIVSAPNKLLVTSPNSQPLLKRMEDLSLLETTQKERLLALVMLVTFLHPLLRIFYLLIISNIICLVLVNYVIKVIVLFFESFKCLIEDGYSKKVIFIGDRKDNVYTIDVEKFSNQEIFFSVLKDDS